MTTTFSDLQLIDPLARAVREEGYERPTPIQVSAIPHVLAGRDLLGLAQTGTGKTAAFALPILHRLAERRVQPPLRGARVLVLAPTRELASQIDDSFAAYARHMRLSHTVIFGYVDLSQLEVLVLDEADRMLDMGFVRDIRRIVATLPQDRQTLMFSATMPK